jgi:hypothetical protein
MRVVCGVAAILALSATAHAEQPKKFPSCVKYIAEAYDYELIYEQNRPEGVNGSRRALTSEEKAAMCDDDLIGDRGNGVRFCGDTFAIMIGDASHDSNTSPEELERLKKLPDLLDAEAKDAGCAYEDEPGAGDGGEGAE